MTQVRITQVTFTAEGVFIGGEPLDDPTKVLVAGIDDPVAALSMAVAVAAGTDPQTDMPEEVVLRVIEKPLNET
jgi:hypothetical protein